MTQESKDQAHDKSASSVGRNAKKEVDLFPPLSDRKLVPIPPARNEGRLGTRISVFEPVSFEEALDIVESLRSRAAITVCLEKMRKVDAVRLVDFVSGASAALDGDCHKLTEQVYVFAPSNIRIVSTSRSELDSRASASGALDYLFANFSGESSRTWAK